MTALLFLITFAGVLFAAFMAGAQEKRKPAILWSAGGFLWALSGGIAMFFMKTFFRKVVTTFSPLANIPAELINIELPWIVMFLVGAFLFLSAMVLFLWAFNSRRNSSKWYWGLLWFFGIMFLFSHVLFVPFYSGLSPWMCFAVFHRNDFFQPEEAILPTIFVLMFLLLVSGLLWLWHTVKSQHHSWKNILTYTGCFTGFILLLWLSAQGVGLWAENAVAKEAAALKIEPCRVGTVTADIRKLNDDLSRFFIEHPKFHPPRSGNHDWKTGDVPADVREYTMKMFDSPEVNAHLSLLRRGAELIRQKNTLYSSALQNFRSLVRYSMDRTELFSHAGKPEKGVAELMKYPELETLIQDTPFLICELLRTSTRYLWISTLTQYGSVEKKYLSDYRNLLAWSKEWQVHLPCEAGMFLSVVSEDIHEVLHFFSKPYLNVVRYCGFTKALRSRPRLETLQRQEVITGKGVFANAARRQRLVIVLGRTALALKVYRIEHGKYPEKLSQLVPHYLEKEYCSPETGKAFTYIVKDGEFTLASDGSELCSEVKK